MNEQVKFNKLKMREKTGYNSTYKKLEVQWLNESLWPKSSSELADRLALQNPRILVAENHLAV